MDACAVGMSVRCISAAGARGAVGTRTRLKYSELVCESFVVELRGIYGPQALVRAWPCAGTGRPAAGRHPEVFFVPKRTLLRAHTHPSRAAKLVLDMPRIHARAYLAADL